MAWTRFFWMLARAALRVLADELDPAGRRPRRPKKDASRSKARRPPKEAPKAEPKRPKPAAPKQAEPSAPYAPQSAESAGWGVNAEPQAVPVIRIETDEGSTVSPLSVLGERAYVPPRPQRERQPGESRRVRRTARAEAPSPEPIARSPEMTACLERMRARASAAACPPGEVGPVFEAPKPPIPARRRRPAGEPLAIAQLMPATLLLLQSGEERTDAVEAAEGER